MPSGVKSIAKLLNQKFTKWTKCFSSSPDRPVQNCDSYTIPFAQNHGWYASPSLFFYNFEVSQGTSNQSLKNCGLICNVSFFTYALVHKALNNEMKLLLKIAELEL